MSESNESEEIIKEWYKKYLTGSIELFPYRKIRDIFGYENESDIPVADLEFKEAHTEIKRDENYNDSVIIQEDIILDDLEKSKIKLYITFLFSAPLDPTEEKINALILGAFYNFGINIGLEAVVIKFVKDLIYTLNDRPVDFTRNVRIIKSLKLKLRKAPYIIFSRKPLDNKLGKKDIGAISLYIKNKKSLKKLLNLIQSSILKGKYPSWIVKIIGWFSIDHYYITKILKAFNGILKYLIEIKDLMLPR